MPDVTSTLLAMYQTIVGGSLSREQASCEAEAARRVITSGLTIAGSGAITIPGTVTIGTLTVTGSVGISGPLTVATLAVTGNATVGGTLGVTGAATVGGLLTASAGLAVTGNMTLAGLLSVTGFGQHTFTAGGAGSQSVVVQNMVAGTGNYAGLFVGNDANPGLASLQAYASTYTSSGLKLANGALLLALGAGGLSIAATDPGGAVRVYSSSVERLRIAPTGEVCINTPSTALTAMVNLLTDGSARNGISLQNTNPANSCFYLALYNSASGLAGSIQQASATTVTFATSSDARLKEDAGRATDLAALRAIVVHDFTWKADGVPDRGIFAQDAHALYPRAVIPGTDATTDDGSLAHPWMTDYSKFVPDLIVGWQQHEAELVTLRALLAQERI